MGKRDQQHQAPSRSSRRCLHASMSMCPDNSTSKLEAQAIAAHPDMRGGQACSEADIAARSGKENVPSVVMSFDDLSLEITKHVDPAHAAKLRALLAALQAGLSLESFCRRVHREMGGNVLRRTTKGLFDLAQQQTRLERPEAERIQKLALDNSKRRHNLDVCAGPLPKRRCA